MNNKNLAKNNNSSSLNNKSTSEKSINKNIKINNDIEIQSNNESNNNISKNKNIIPKNINEYFHLLENKSTNKMQLDWTLTLRTPIKIKKIKHNQSCPSFYDVDLLKYKKKLQKKSNEPFLLKKNPFELYKLVKNKINTISLQTLNYESTLRNGKLPKGFKPFFHKKDWENIENYPPSKVNDSLPPLRSFSKEILKKIDKYCVKSYDNNNFMKTKFNNQNIIKRIIKTKGINNWRGEHLETIYKEKYNDKNCVNNLHILKKENLTLSKFEISLRSYNNKPFDTTTTKKKIHIKKL